MKTAWLTTKFHTFQTEKQPSVRNNVKILHKAVPRNLNYTQPESYEQNYTMFHTGTQPSVRNIVKILH